MVPCNCGTLNNPPVDATHRAPCGKSSHAPPKPRRFQIRCLVRKTPTTSTLAEQPFFSDESCSHSTPKGSFFGLAVSKPALQTGNLIPAEGKWSYRIPKTDSTLLSGVAWIGGLDRWLGLVAWIGGLEVGGRVPGWFQSASFPNQSRPPTGVVDAN